MMTIEEVKFKEAIKNIRKRANLSQAAFGKLFNVDQQAVSKWENGKGYPEVATLIKIAAFADMSLDDLIFTTGYTRDELKFLEDTQKISVEDLSDKYQLVIDDKPATESEIKEAIRFIQFNRVRQ